MKLINFVQPIQYTNYELNILHKRWDKNHYKILLVFPDTYTIGMSHYGFGLIYNQLYNIKNVIVDRAFMPQTDYYDFLIENNIQHKSLHYKKDFKEFDFIGFSISYELSILNIIAILKSASIPLYKKDRNENLPIIACGGTATYNPYILQKVFDFIYIGDAENRFNEIIHHLMNSTIKNKFDKILSLKKFNNIYIEKYNENAEKYSTQDLTTDYYNQPIPLFKTVHNRGVVEIMRGCLRNCRFCQAGYIYRPLRLLSVDDIYELTKNIYYSTGFEEISYLSLSSSDYPLLNDLLHKLLPFILQHKISISFPSQRIDKLDNELCKFLNENKKSGLTLAVEAGSEKLRNIINKNISNAEIFKALESAINRGWRKVKLYFMIGLPYEKDEDVVAIVKLINDIMLNFGKKILSLNVSVTNFIPKLFTPFQHQPFADISVLNEKISYIRQNLKSKKIKLSWAGPVQSKLEYLFSNGNENFFDDLYNLYNENQNLFLQDRSENFKENIWSSFINNYSNQLTVKNKISIDVSETFLIKENIKAANSEITNTCLTDKCINCGIKDCSVRSNKNIIVSEHQENEVVKNYSKNNDIKQIDTSYDYNEKVKNKNIGYAHDYKGNNNIIENDSEYDYNQKVKNKTIGYAHDYNGTNNTIENDSEYDYNQKVNNKNIGYAHDYKGNYDLKENILLTNSNDKQEIHQKIIYRIQYKKLENIKYMSSLDLQSLWYRLLRKNNIPLVYSQGYNKKPLLVFSQPIPLGIVSFKEYLDFTAKENIDTDKLKTSINQFTKNRIEIIKIFKVNKYDNNINNDLTNFNYNIKFSIKYYDRIYNNFNDILAKNNIVFEKIKSGKKQLKYYNIDDYLVNYSFTKNNENGELNIQLKTHNEKTLPIMKLLSHLIDLDKYDLITKL